MWHRVGVIFSFLLGLPLPCSSRIDTRFPHRFYCRFYSPCFILCFFHIHGSVHLPPPLCPLCPLTPPLPPPLQPPTRATHTPTDGCLTPARRAESQRAHVPAVAHAGDHPRRHPLPVQDPRRVPAGGRAVPDLLQPQLRAGHAGREWGWEWERQREHKWDCQWERLRRDWRDKGRGTLWERAGGRWRGGACNAGKQLFRRRTTRAQGESVIATCAESTGLTTRDRTCRSVGHSRRTPKNSCPPAHSPHPRSPHSRPPPPRPHRPLRSANILCPILRPKPPTVSHDPARSLSPQVVAHPPWTAHGWVP